MCFNKESIIEMTITKEIELILKFKNERFTKQDVLSLLIDKTEETYDNSYYFFQQLMDIQFIIPFPLFNPEEYNLNLSNDSFLKKPFNEAISCSKEFGEDKKNKINALSSSLNLNKKFVLLEDSYISEKVNLNINEYQSTLNDFQILQNFNLLFDKSIEMRQEFSNFYKKSINKATNIFDLYSLFINFTKSKNEVKGNNPIKLLQKEFFEVLYEKKGQKKVNIDTNFLKNLLDNMPSDLIQSPTSYSYYCQLADDKILLNNISSGYGRAFSRYTNYDINLLDRIKKTIKNYELESGYTLASTQYSVGSNGNIHPTLTDYWIDYTGTSSNTSNENRRITLDKIIPTIDEKTNLLNFNYNNQQIWPIHQGIMSYSWLPNLYRFICSFTTTDAFNFEFGQDLKYHLGTYENIPIYYCPEISFGNITISREKWIINNKLLKDKLSNFTSWRSYMFLNNLLHSFGISNEFFIKSDTYNKPLYINIENKFLLNLFLKSINNYDDFFYLEPLFPKINNKFTNDLRQQEHVFEIYGNKFNSEKFKFL